MKTTEDGIKYTVTGTNVNVRTEPSMNGKVLFQLNTGDEVLHLEQKKEIVTIKKWKGTWIKIKYKGKAGWVFSSFLTKQTSEDSATETEDNSNENPAGESD